MLRVFIHVLGELRLTTNMRLILYSTTGVHFIHSHEIPSFFDVAHA